MKEFHCSDSKITNCSLNVEKIEDYLLWEEKRRVSSEALRKLRRFIYELFFWLGENKSFTKEELETWRLYLQEKGYSKATIQNYIKGINRYLDYAGYDELKYQRGKTKEISGKTFGYLTVLGYAGYKKRNNYVWKCKCKCGKKIDVPSTRLLTGNTLSCGCMKKETLQSSNMYIEKTSIRQSLKNQIESNRASSGYTGVTAKRNKWQAYITYKGKRYSLGCYENIEDAVEVRKKAKEIVQEDANRLMEVYSEKSRRKMKIELLDGVK